MYRILHKPLRSNLFGLDDAAAVALATGVISGGVTMYNNHKQRKEQRSLMDKSIESNIQQWNRETQYNTPQAQMKRFKDAGLNPNLIYGQSNTASSMTPSTDVPEAKMPSNSFTQGVQTYNNNRLLDAQIENIQADTDKKKVEAGNSSEMVKIQRDLAEYTKWKTEAYIDDLLDKKGLRGARREWFRQSCNKMQQDIRESIVRTMLGMKDYQHYDERFNQTMAESRAKVKQWLAHAVLDEANRKKVEREIFEMQDTYERRCNKLLSEINLNTATEEEKKAVAEKLIMEAVSLGSEAQVNLASYFTVKNHMGESLDVESYNLDVSDVLLTTFNTVYKTLLSSPFK